MPKNSTDKYYINLTVEEDTVSITPSTFKILVEKINELDPKTLEILYGKKGQS